MDRLLNCENYRRFGVELELNTADGIVKKLDKSKNEIPLGADRVAILIRRTLKAPVEIQCWDYNYNNEEWIIKPDRSCGMEVCTPVLKGYKGICDLVKVVEAFRKNSIRADDRCSLHVHVNIADLNINQLASVIAWYIKCEHVFMDSVPSHRKINRYCQMLGMTDFITTNFQITPNNLLEAVSLVKYYSLNAYHFLKGGGFNEYKNYNSRKKTIEFRIGEAAMCLDSFAVKNWIRLLLHFVDVTKDLPLPKKYEVGNPWSGLLWLDPQDVFGIMGFDQPCSEGLTQVKNWFASRIIKNIHTNRKTGVFSHSGRFESYRNFLDFYEKFCNEINIDYDDEELMNDLLYNRKFSK